MLFRRDLLMRIGLFDEIYGANKNVFDDFCVRAVLEGYRTSLPGTYTCITGVANRLLSRDKTLFDEKWLGLDASSSLAEKVLIENAMEKSRSLYNKGDIDNAIKTLIGRIGFSPHENKLYYLLAEILIEEKRFQDALDALKGMSVMKMTRNIMRYWDTAMKDWALYSEAEEYADKALAVNSKSAPALNLKGILAYRKDETGESRRAFPAGIGG